ncbi:hypothetical protein BT96DRAFT_815673, partial [Gymnopus androsaceus JB14]
KAIAIKLRHRDATQLLEKDEILQICGMSKKTFYCTQKRYQESGSVAKAKAIGCGRPRILQDVDAAFLISLA